MKVVGIIGAGQLGSRHLQALAGVAEPLSIYVSDINSKSLVTAKARFEEVNKNPEHIVHYVPLIEAFPAYLDVVIIATNSLIRKAVTKELLAAREVKHLILEKFLFPRLSDYDEVSGLLEEHTQLKAWVNCPRRTFDVYKEIINEVNGNGPVNFSVTGSAWGLGCNSVHFVDLFSRLTGEAAVHLIGESIDDEYLPSKRNGYVEFSGSIYLGTSNGDRMEVVSFKTGSHPIIVKISTPTACWIINETAKECRKASVSTGWEFHTTPVIFPMQSQAGTVIVNDLFEKNDCDLTSYEVSQQLHRCLLDTFLNKFNSINKETKDLCPIT